MLTWEEIIDAEEPGERTEYGKLSSGIVLYRQARSLIAMLPDMNFRTLSTAYFNGGFIDSPDAVVNTSSFGGIVEEKMMPNPISLHNECTSIHYRKMGLDPKNVVGLATAANMDNASISHRPGNIDVSCAMTGGIRGNGGRAGDPAWFDESESDRISHGTIMIILAIDSELSDGAMIDAVSIATEAKSCVIQELHGRSLYSPNIATGSGTDQVVVISRIGNTKTEKIERGSELSVQISECVKTALYETFDRQSGMTLKTQMNGLIALNRVGITQKMIHNEIRLSSTMDNLIKAENEIYADVTFSSQIYSMLAVHDAVVNGHISQLDALDFTYRFCKNVILNGIKLENVMDLRLKRSDTIPLMLSLATALKIREKATELGGSNYVR